MIDKSYKIEFYLKWILDAIERIEYYNKKWNIDTDSIVLDSCLMQLVHIWETVNKIKKKFPNFKLIPNNVIKLRNFVAHDYIWINISIVKIIINKHLPDIKQKILDYFKEIKID